MARKPALFDDRVYIRIDPATRRALDDFARREGMTVSELLRQAARRAIREASDGRAAA